MPIMRNLSPNEGAFLYYAYNVRLGLVPPPGPTLGGGGSWCPLSPAAT